MDATEQQPRLYKMFKIYDENNNTIITNNLSEVRELTGASAAQIKKLFVSNFLTINSFSVFNYNN